MKAEPKIKTETVVKHQFYRRLFKKIRILILSPWSWKPLYDNWKEIISCFPCTFSKSTSILRICNNECIQHLPNSLFNSRSPCITIDQCLQCNNHKANNSCQKVVQSLDKTYAMIPMVVLIAKTKNGENLKTSLWNRKIKELGSDKKHAYFSSKSFNIIRASNCSFRYETLNCLYH